MSKRILYVSKITERFQTTIPKIVREILEINNNQDRLVWILDSGEIKIKKA